MLVLLQKSKFVSKKVFKVSFCKYMRYSSDQSHAFLTFAEVVAHRKQESSRSIAVQVNSESSFSELHAYCSKYSEIKGVHHYKNSVDENFMLVEFKNEENLYAGLENCSSFTKNCQIMSHKSPFMWFRNSPEKNNKVNPPFTYKLETTDGIADIDEEILYNDLLKCDSISHQIQLLYDDTVLNDLGFRLRYLVARQLELAFQGLYAKAVVWPFGSSVNGFGKMGCDLDLVLTNDTTKEMSELSRRLVYQSGGEGGAARHMALAGDVVELCVPGATRVNRIPFARVPIVKYSHRFTDVECDLCFNNLTGVYMSELLWTLGEADARVRPLVATVRRWARAASITSAHPGRWLTNFSLTLMVIFFLQQRKPSVLPTVKCLVKNAGKEDVRITEEKVNCTFLRDLNKLPKDSYGHNESDLQTLLLQFFEYYAQFNFDEHAISINDGVPIRKPNVHPLYIVNPLEQIMNVSRNVSYDECERLKLEVKNAAWQIEAGLDSSRSDDWGILGIIEKKSMRDFKKLIRSGNSRRLLSVRDLFQDDQASDTKSTKTDQEINDSVKKIKNNVEKQTRIKGKTKFKNSLTAAEVYRIRRDKLL